jgi:hypothetical protein
VNCTVWTAVSDAVDGVTVTVIVGFKVVGFKVMVAVAEVLAALAACTVTVCWAVIDAGAV